MRWTLQDAMRWIHTLGGIITGLVLMMVFLMGTISVFDCELDRWMIPDTRLPSVTEEVSLDKIVRPLVAQITPPGDQVRQWWVVLPNARNPFMVLELNGQHRMADPRTGRLLPDAGTFGASHFFRPLHYSLHLRVANLGMWLIGLASMVMLLCLVSGVIIHARIFKDFFTFRPGKNLQRSVLDLHNLVGVLALPFHFMITFSGLIIFFLIYLPSAIQVLYPKGSESFYTQWLSLYDRPAAMRPAPLASLDEMAAVARRIWDGSALVFVRVRHPGDANAYVEMRPLEQNLIGHSADAVYFDGSTSAVLQIAPLRPVSRVQRFIVNLHVITFDSSLLRWLYFLGGLAGCALIATGMLYWVEKRRVKHARQGQRSLSLAAVSGITCAAITGLPLATLSMLLVNRMLPPLLHGRQWIEVIVFFSVWLLTALHGIAGTLWRHDGSAPWRTQCEFIVVLALGCVVANALSTGDHLLRTVARGDWAVAGTDLVLLATAAGAAYATRRLALHAQQKPVKVPGD